MINVGDAVPEIAMRIMSEGKPAEVPMSVVIGEGRTVLFAVPGAFTPGCSKQHLPSFVGNAAALSAAGVDRIVCLSVNDVFVMHAWGEAQGVGESISMVADPAGAFTEAVGMAVDASAFGLGVRSKRYAMVIEGGIVTAFLPEEDGFAVLASTAPCVLDALA